MFFQRDKNDGKGTSKNIRNRTSNENLGYPPLNCAGKLFTKKILALLTVCYDDHKLGRVHL